MRRIERTGQFRRDWKRESKGRYRDVLAGEFVTILTALVNDRPLDPRHRDHALAGE